jgi:hypothetical protein
MASTQRKFLRHPLRLGGLRRLLVCVAAGVLLALAPAAMISLARSAQYPRRWFDAYEGSGRERSVAASVTLTDRANRRLLNWDRAPLWDSIRLQRMSPSEWTELDKRSPTALAKTPTLPSWAISPSEETDVGLIETIAYGWPIRVLRVQGRLIVAPEDFSAIIRKESDGLGDFDNPWAGRPAWGVAWIPIWPGLLLSGGLYGATVWILWSSTLNIHRKLQVRRGRCVHCGYDLKGTESTPSPVSICPECGRTARAV